MIGLFAKRRRLTASHVEAHLAPIEIVEHLVDDGRVVLVFVVVVVAQIGGDQLFELHQHAVVAAVVAETDRPEHERLLPGGTAEVDGVREGAILGRGQVGQDTTEVLGDGADLLLLAPHRHPLATGPGVEVEHAGTGLSDGSGGERVDVVELEVGAHRYDAFSSASEPVELTASTAGPKGDHVTTLTEHVETTMRWN